MNEKILLAKSKVAKDVAIECLKVLEALADLEIGFIEGISGSEARKLIKHIINGTKEMARISRRTVGIRNILTGEVEEVKIDLIEASTIFILQAKIELFSDLFPVLYLEDYEEVEELVNDFFESIIESFDEIFEELNEAIRYLD